MLQLKTLNRRKYALLKKGNFDEIFSYIFNEFFDKYGMIDGLNDDIVDSGENNTSFDTPFGEVFEFKYDLDVTDIKDPKLMPLAYKMDIMEYVIFCDYNDYHGIPELFLFNDDEIIVLFEEFLKIIEKEKHEKYVIWVCQEEVDTVLNNDKPYELETAIKEAKEESSLMRTPVLISKYDDSDNDEENLDYNVYMEDGDFHTDVYAIVFMDNVYYAEKE